MSQFDPVNFRRCFPALNQEIIYLDSAATALKPSVMIDATQQYYAENTATAYRSIHFHAQQITAQLEQARQSVACLLNSPVESIIWTKGSTESVNLIAQSYARSLLQPGDEIIVSELEHHSNLLPWLIVAEQTGAKVIKWPVNSHTELCMETLCSLLNHRTKIVAVTQMSNVTGYQPDLAKISHLVHQQNAILVVDGAQGIVHTPIDVTQIDIDFYLFSTHKLYGPTGLGILYSKSNLLEQMPVWHGGGKMLKTASFSGFEAQLAPEKFEAGTPNIAGILGFSATLKWLDNLDWLAAQQYVSQLTEQLRQQISQFKGFIDYSHAHSHSLLSFNFEGIHHSDIAILLAEQKIAVRTGELCAQPLMQVLGCSGVIRVSLLPYNNQQDIDKFILAMQNVLAILA